MNDPSSCGFSINYLFMLCLILFYKLFGEKKIIFWLYILIFWNEIKIASTSKKKFL